MNLEYLRNWFIKSFEEKGCIILGFDDKEIRYIDRNCSFCTFPYSIYSDDKKVQQKLAEEMKG